MTKNIEQKFPLELSLDSLIRAGAKPIKDMIYFKLEINGYFGVYEPLERNENGKIAEYVLRNILPNKRIIEAEK